MAAPDRRLERLAQWLFAGCLLAALPAVVIPLGLLPEGDAADYRVPMLQWMLRHQALPNWPWTPVDNYPLLGELLMLPLRAWHPGLDRLVPLAATAGIGLAAGALFRRLKPELGATGFWVAAALAAALRPVAVGSNLLLVDNLAAGGLLGALVLMVRNRPAAAGLACGLALATRYSVWPLVPPLGLAAVALGWRGAALARFALAAVVPVLPLLIRNHALEGNAVFPLLTSLAGPPDVDVRIAWEKFGRASPLTGLLLLPFDLLFTNEFRGQLFDYRVGSSFLLLLAFMAAGFGWRREAARAAWAQLRADPVARALAVFAASGLGLWVLTAPQLRFAVTELVVLLVLVLALVLPWAGRRVIGTLFAAAVLTLGAVHHRTWLQAAGLRPGPFEAARRAAEAEFARAGIPADEPVGWVRRDQALGYLDRDFVFLGPHPLALGPKREPAVTWIYDSQATPALRRRPAPAR